MHLIKLIHFAALLVWCGTLLYLPPLLAAEARPAAGGAGFSQPRVLRQMFTLAASPAAILAIGSGSILFVGVSSLAPWLILKLSAVALLVLCHALFGVLVLRAEQGRTARLARLSAMLGLAAVLLVALILWLVLAKPF